MFDFLKSAPKTVLILGSYPTPKFNVEQHWHGSPANMRFNMWLDKLGLSLHPAITFYNATHETKFRSISKARIIPHHIYHKIIVLGPFAEAALVSQNGTHYFYLPMPDSRTADAMSKWGLMQELDRCRAYLEAPQNEMLPSK